MFYFVVEMDSGVLISLILGASTVIASFINCSFNRISRKAERLEAQNNKLFHDLESFLEIEQEFSKVCFGSIFKKCVNIYAYTHPKGMKWNKVVWA